MSGFKGAAIPLTAGGLKACADALSIGLLEIWTVLTVETRGCGFFEDGRPAILYERHIFHRLTKGRFSTPEHEGISHHHSGGYSGGLAEYGRLEQALRLDRAEALKSASWGLGQVMGFHAEALGYASVEDFVARMVESEDHHLVAFTRFIVHNKLDDALRSHDWSRFARGYNGAAYEKNAYDKKLAEAYAKLSTRHLPDLTVREGQVRLMLRGFKPGAPDGYFGKRTREAMHRFQQQCGLPLTDTFDGATLDALRETRP